MRPEAHTGSVPRLRAVVASAALAIALGASSACGTASTPPSSTSRGNPPTTASPSAPPSASPSVVAPSATRGRVVPDGHDSAIPVTAGHRAWVSVAVARLWQSPASPRAVDAPALAAPVRFRQWLDAMTLTERKALSDHSDTEAVMGERVLVRQVSGRWASVVVPDQPSQKDPGGYPGWVPLRS